MKKKLSASISMLIASVALLLFLPGSSLRLLRIYLRHYGLNRNIFKYFRHLPGDELIIMLFALFFIVLIIICVINIIVLSARIRANRSAVSAASSSARSAHRPSARHVTEEAIDCSHSTGRAKYLEQIDGYLKNGLIDKAEYNSLKARYERLDIPDDYHG